MREEPLRLQGAAVRPLPRKNRTWGPGRVCAEDGCVTRLSIYNKSTYCWAHEPLHYYVSRGRKRRAAEAA